MVLTRRAFIGGVAATAWAGRPVLAARPAAGQGSRAGLSVDAAVLRQRIEALSIFGRRAGGSFADGVSRVAYTDADIAGRAYVMDLLRTARLTPRVDPAGNIFAMRPGTNSSLKPILFGSHIDSVPNGGNFDGDLGSLAAIGAIDALSGIL